MTVRWLAVPLTTLLLVACGSPEAGDTCAAAEDCGDELVCDIDAEADEGVCAKAGSGDEEE